MADDGWNEPRELLEFAKRDSRNKPGAGWKMRVVEYIKDGVSKSVKLEAGEFYPDQETKKTRFKSKGLTWRDIDTLRSIDPNSGHTWITVAYNLMKNPPPIPPEYLAQQGAAGAGAMTNDNEVPF